MVVVVNRSVVMVVKECGDGGEESGDGGEKEC